MVLLELYLIYKKLLVGFYILVFFPNSSCEAFPARCSTIFLEIFLFILAMSIFRIKKILLLLIKNTFLFVSFSSFLILPHNLYLRYVNIEKDKNWYLWIDCLPLTRSRMKLGLSDNIILNSLEFLIHLLHKLTLSHLSIFFQQLIVYNAFNSVITLGKWSTWTYLQVTRK